MYLNLDDRIQLHWPQRRAAVLRLAAAWYLAVQLLTCSSALAQSGDCLPPAPEVTEVSCEAYTLSWPAIDGAEQYIVSTTHLGRMETGQQTTTEPRLTLTAQANSTYLVEVGYVCSGRLVSAFVELETPACDVLECPTLALETGNLTCEEARLQWQEIPVADSFRVQYRERGASARETVWTTDSSFSFPVNEVTEYEVQVAYRCGEQWVEGELTFRSPACETGPPCERFPVELVELACDQATFSWPEVPGVDQYEIHYRAEGNSSDLREVVTDNGVDLPVQPETGYTVRIGYRCDDKLVATRVELTTPVCEPACEPLEVSVENLSCSGADLIWNAVDGVGRYQVFLTDRGNNQTDSVTVGRNTVRLPLAAETSYLVQVVYDCQGSPVVAQVEFVTPACPFECPEVELIPELINCELGSLTWEPVQGVGEYTLRLTNLDTRQTETFRTADTFLELPLASETRYRYVFSYSCEQGGDPVELVQNFETPACPPDCPPVEPRIVSTECENIRLFWQASQGVDYRVIVTDIASQQADTQTVRRLPLNLPVAPENRYLLEVQYFCGDEWVTSAPIEVETPACAADCPEAQFFPPQPSCDNANLVWLPVAGVNTYTIRVINLATDETETYTTSQTRQQVPLQPETAYQIELIYECENGETARVERRVETPACGDNCPAPELSIEELSCRGVFITWPPIQGARGYQVRVLPVGNGQPQQRNVFRPEIELDLEPETTYGIQVAYQCEGEEVTVDTTISTPACDDNCEPLNVEADDVQCDGARIVWNAVPGIDSYQVTYRTFPDFQTETIEVSTSEAQLTLPDNAFIQITVAYDCSGERIEDQTTIQTPACNADRCPVPEINQDRVRCESVEISWDAQPLAQGYTVTVRGLNGQPESFDVTRPEASLTVQPEQVYFVTVAYLCEGDTVSGQTVVRTPACDAEPCPDLSIFPPQPECDQMRLVWAPAPGANEYRIRVRTLFPPQTQEVFSQLPTVVIEDLRENTVYTVSVAYECDGEWKETTLPLPIRTPACDGGRESIPSTGAVPAEMKVYPNPARGRFFIRFTPQTEQATLLLRDETGRTVYRQVVTSDVHEGATPRELEIQPGAALPAGLYLLELRQGDTLSRTRLLFQP